MGRVSVPELTIAEVAVMCSKHKTTTLRQAHRGQLGPYRIVEGQIRFAAKDLERHLGPAALAKHWQARRARALAELATIEAELARLRAMAGTTTTNSRS